MYYLDKQIGFARVVTDKAVFSWVLDVVIDQNYRGKGLGTWLMKIVYLNIQISNLLHYICTGHIRCT
ncbi:GNAT family N-acetyltransferase [Metabacillus niabensis]|uniref:GNAT family N-acetyltransferase n=1 Tax=Metabacillus niabensis TaxID=324854 RepID=UPI001CFB4317|nr:GNAT family N-acetyltransferase [Metabacillus niabensis]